MVKCVALSSKNPVRTNGSFNQPNRAMKSKMLNLGIMITSLLGYHEWGADNKYFIFQMEWEVITKMVNDISAGFHPLILLPMLGQILLLITLFQKEPGRLLTYLGTGMLCLILAFIFLIGLLNLDIKVIASFIPFILMVALMIRHQRTRSRRNIT